MVRILLVDDDDMVRASIHTFLQETGYEVVEAAHGLMALDIIKHDSDFDLALCDLAMPEMDGLTLITVLRRERPELPVIVLSGQGTIEAAVQAMRLGALNYLVKPLDSKKMLASIEEAVRAREAQSQRRQLVERIKSDLLNLRTFETTITPPILSRSIGGGGHAAIAAPSRQFNIGELIVDEEHVVAYFRDRQIELTPTEFEILRSLVQARGRVVTFEELLFELRGVRISRQEARRSLSAHLSNLRAKLRDAGCPEYLVNRRNRGYFLNLD